MIRYKYRWLVGALCISALFGASACSTQEEVDVPPLLSDTEITLSLPEWTPIVQSRATLFEDKADLFDPKKGGGNFTLYAYVNGTDKKYIDGVRGWYFKEDKKWMILDNNRRPLTYYWPNSDKLNFFAFMPNLTYNGEEGYYSEDTHVEVLPYTSEKGQEFACNLPFSVGGDDDPKIQEFIYAYETDKSKQKDPLPLGFKHPFALINFKLKVGSYRMTIDKIEFNPIHLKGTFSTATKQWMPTTDTGEKYTVRINKRVPNDINYNTNLSEWLIVMPQELKNVCLTLHAHRANNEAVSESVSKTYTFAEDAEWEPGHKYTYIISYGDNKEEIYFNVIVEDWFIGGEQDIDVE